MAELDDTARYALKLAPPEAVAAWKKYTRWLPMLEGFQMERISIVEEWKDKAARSAERKVIARVLQVRFGQAPTAEAQRHLDAADTPEALERLTDLASTAASMEAFVAEAAKAAGP